MPLLDRAGTRRAALALAVFSLAAPASAGPGPDHRPQVAQYFDSHVAGWIGSEPIVAALRAQNAENVRLTQGEIDELDATWRAQMASEGNRRPLVQAVMDREASRYLKERQREADWMIVEIIVMDAKGLNVALSTPSSDYWQGDEAKHQKTFQAASRVTQIDAVEYEAETGLLLSQVNKTIFDPDTGRPIGAVTVSVNMNKL
ncbi:hypothetical protein [Pararhizobium haloflavum]|uniref:hypothetical protein n=1 Tax=Pararhizobium haloflavum TaxID=2037914 RepID=UPI000C19E5CC|nr:hypothetical protein [Pararhizobium haloflavum]